MHRYAWVEFGETNAVIRKVFGWVRDMYAFDFAAGLYKLCLAFRS